jgi:phosphoglycolate phosphatase
VKGVIFDLDGTLADTLADITSALNHVLGELSLPPHSPDQTVAWVGWGVRHLVDRAVSDPRLVDEAVTRFRARYAANLIRDSAPYPGVPDLLDGLTADGVPIAVLSNKPHPMTVRIVREIFGRWQFAAVRGHRPPTPRKPDPTAALEIAAELGLAPAELVFVGDTAVDVDTALAAQMTAVAVSWGFRSADQLRGAGAAEVFARPAELLDWLRRDASA